MENKEAKEILARMLYDEDYAYSYEFKHIEIILEAFKQLEKENSMYYKLCEKHNNHIHELESCIQHLQGNKRNRDARIRNLEKQLQAKDKAFEKVQLEAMTYDQIEEYAQQRLDGIES